MATDLEIDPASTTTDEVPPSPETTEPAPAATESVEELKAKLAAAESEASTWKGRAEKATEKKKKETSISSADLEALEWKIANKDRIELVKDEYEKIRVDGYQGEKVSDKIALELAEKLAKIDTSGAKRNRQNDMTTPSVTNRAIDPKGYETETDKALGLTAEQKRKLEEKYPHLKEAY